jgi:hypothetical protein
VQKKITAALPLDSYEDPALAKVKPPVKETDSVWFDDAFPTGAKVTPTVVGAPLLVDKPVHSGTKALKITSPVLAQDFMIPVPSRSLCRTMVNFSSTFFSIPPSLRRL